MSNPITLSAPLLFLALSNFIMLYHFIVYLVHCLTSYTRMGEAPMNVKQKVIIKKLNKFHFMNTGGQGPGQA